MDRDTLELAVRGHQAEVYRYVRYLGADRSAAEDLVQETFLAALKTNRHPPADDPRGMSAWLRAVARNMFLRYCRREKASRVLFNSEYAEEAETVWIQDFLRGGDGFDYEDALRQCLESASPDQRKALDMRYRQRQSRNEMARQLGMTGDGVKSLLRRIRAALAACVERRLAREMCA